MIILIVGLALFLGTHSISMVAPAWRDRTAARMGERTFQGIYSLIAIAGFVLIVWGYGVARQEPIALYHPPVWLRHLALLLMVPVFPLLLATYLPGRIRTATKHPMLAAVKLWAFAHLLANGNLADVVLFGSFLLWAILDRISMKWRQPHPVPSAPESRLNDLIVIVAGLALYVIFVLGLHRWLIGVSPLGQ
jgi:uncharacterized membrane protein